MENNTPEIETTAEQTSHVSAPVYAPLPAQTDPVVGTGAFFGLEFLFALPLIGFICCLIFSFAPKNRNLKHYARGKLIWSIIALVLSILLIFCAAIFLQALPGMVSEELGIEVNELDDIFSIAGELPELIEELGGIEEVAGLVGNMGDIAGIVGQLGEIEGIEQVISEIGEMENIEEVIGALENLENIESVVGDMENIENIEELAEQINDPQTIEQLLEAYKNYTE